MITDRFKTDWRLILYFLPSFLPNFPKKYISSKKYFQSWEALPADTATFTPDITPLILAAHTDNYEVIKILLDRGATLPTPHDIR